MAASSAEFGIGRSFDALLRSKGRYAPTSTVVPWRSLAAFTVACAFLYGCVMGAYALRGQQALYSGIKAPLLLATTTAVCLPSFFVLNTILGLRDDFAAACRAIFVTQAVLAAALAALAPVTAFVYASDVRYSTAVVTSGAAFLLASTAAQTALGRHYRLLIAKDPRHRTALRAWIGLYLFVGIQCAWVLRPFVGAPMMSIEFFRRNAWSNAYLVIIDDVIRLFTGR